MNETENLETFNNNKNDENNENKSKLLTIVLTYVNDCVLEMLSEKQKECEIRQKKSEERYKEKIENETSFDGKALAQNDFLENNERIEKEKIEIIDYKENYKKTLNIQEEIDENYKVPTDSFLFQIVKSLLKNKIVFDNTRMFKLYINQAFENHFLNYTQSRETEGFKTFQFAQLSEALKNAIYIDIDNSSGNTNFDDDEKEKIRTLYMTNVSDEIKKVYPLHAIKQIIVISNYSDVDYYINNEETLKKFMPPEDIFKIKSDLRKHAIALYGYNDIFEVEDRAQIHGFPESVRTPDNYFKAVMFIDNVNMRTFSISDQEDEETSENIISELDNEKYQEHSIEYTLKQIDRTNLLSIEQQIIKYTEAYKNAIESDKYAHVENVENNLENENDNKLNNKSEVISTEKTNETIDEINSFYPTNNEESEQPYLNNDILNVLNAPSNNTINSNSDEEEYDEVIFIPVKNLMNVTPAKIYIGVDLDETKDTSDPENKLIFSVNRTTEVYGYKGKNYFKVIDNHYPIMSLARGRDKIIFRPSKERVSAAFLRSKFKIAKRRKFNS